MCYNHSKIKPSLLFLKKDPFWFQPREVQVFMFLWMTLLTLAPVIGQLETARKPVISLQPPWTTVFQGDTVTLTCNGFRLYPPQKTKWEHRYSGKEIETPGNTLKVRESGEYSCQIRGSPPSNPVHLVFSSDPLILQAPLSVSEGDKVVLRCQTRAKGSLYTIYKDGQCLQHLERSSSFTIGHARLEDNGDYHCNGYTEDLYLSSNTVKIQVRVKRVFANFQTHPLPASKSVFEGQDLLFTCSADGVPGATFSWYRRFKNLGKERIWMYSRAEFQILVKSSHAGEYFCEAKNKRTSILRSNPVAIEVKVPVSHPVLTISSAGAGTFEGALVTLRCEAQRGSLPILYQFYREDARRGSRLILPTGRASFNLSLTIENSGNYYCTADNGLGPQRSELVKLPISVPVSRPILTFKTPRTQAVLGDMVKLCCEAQRGSSPILYWFYHDDVTLGSTIVPYRGEASINLYLTAEHSGNYFCEADNGLGAQRSDAVSLSVTIPASQPVLTLRTPRAQAVVGDMVKLSCEAQRGSPPILYRFYHNDVTLGSSSSFYGEEASINLYLTAEHSGNYFCEADNGLGAQRSDAVSLSVTIPASQPVLTLRTPRAQAVVGDMVKLSCEAQRGSPPILYRFYHNDVTLGSSSSFYGEEASINLYLTAEHSGNYFCEADNGLGAQRSDAVSLSVTIPASQPILTFRTPRGQAVVGDVVKLCCEAQSGSPPIVYRFYRENFTLGSSSAPYGGEASTNLSVTAEHSGNYFCEADNGLGAQRSEVVTLEVTVPASRPILTVRMPRAQTVVGDMVELRCEALKGSPPVLYQFYHENFTLGNSSAPSGGGASINLSLTAEHSGNYSCEANNGLGAQRSEVVTLIFTGLPDNRKGLVATGVTGGLFSMMGLAAGALLLYCWLSRKAGGRLACDPSRSPSDMDPLPQEPTYHNVPGWIELQPVYSNINPSGGDVVYSEVQSIQKKKRRAASAPGHSRNKATSVIYSQVKVASAPASTSQLSASSASSAPHR
ncbi:Fc receptor-like protein 5 isoform X2 [Nycticebus coucang]|uniref:Fc receptor-like protein 5 isoform X2 n=1 Tax=Nycticebus coucang TaxID=9470 RepID=UPI00234CE04D|nr:Fc receptor-like protein 5 isoform X2 [Nycticebus coucang]